MDAIELLKNQHAEIDGLFADLERANNEDEDLFAELTHKLATHLKVEGNLFYPIVTTEQTEDLLARCEVEHLAINHLLDRLLKLDVYHPTFDATLAVLKEQVRHHVHLDELLFAEVTLLLHQEDLDGLGDAMRLAFDVILTTTAHDDRARSTPLAAA